MKRFVLGLLAGVWFAGGAFGLNDRGNIGLGIMTAQTNPDILVSNALRPSLFLDLGTVLTRHVSGGLEIQGDLAQLTEQNFILRPSDIARYHLGHGEWVGFLSPTSYRQTYTLQEADLSPRGYLAYEWGKEAWFQGFAGLNFNWQSLEYSIKNTSGTTLDDLKGHTIAPGETNSSKDYLGQNVQLVVGARLAVSLFYFEFTRYVNLNSDGFSLTDTDLSRFGLGVSLRF